MIRSRIVAGIVSLSLAVAVVYGEDTPAEQAAKVARQAMAKAQADKARNDAIVEQQRAAEKAAKLNAAKDKSAPKPQPKAPSK